MRSIPAFTLVGFVLSAAPAAAQRELAPPALTPAAGGPALLADVSISFDQMEKNIEQQYAKLIRKEKDQKSALEDTIKDLDRQIQAVKEQIKKIQLVAQRIQELLPKILSAVGSDSGGVFGGAFSEAKRAQLEALLAAELSKAGVSLSAKEIQGIAAAITKGGQGGMSTALQIVITIAEAGAARSPDFPKVVAAEVSSAASLPGASAAAFFSSRFSDQASRRIQDFNRAIDSANAEKKTLKERIAALDKQIAKLEEDKAKALAELRKQKEKAIVAAKAIDTRIVRLPTPTPTPKRP